MNAITVYHGTDGRILNMTEQERLKFKEYCLNIADRIRPYFVDTSHLCLYKDFLITEDNPYLYNNLLEKIAMYDAMKTGSELYKYDSFYVTTSLERAKGYACRSFVFGELGLMAYRLLKAAIHLGLQKIIHPATMKYFQHLLDFAENEQASPVVLEFTDVPISNLTLENGKTVEGFLPCNMDISLRCIEPLDMNTGKRIICH